MGKAFADGAARVWFADIDAKTLEQVTAAWRRDRLDVTDEAAVTCLMTRLHEDRVGLDGLCANAGVAGPTARIEEIDLEAWRRCLAVNLDGAFLFAKHATPMMKAQRSGSIILTSSTAGIYGYPNRAPYAAAKWALNGLMKTLAMELAPSASGPTASAPARSKGRAWNRCW